MNHQEREGALQVLTILDLSQGIAGPYAGRLFAQYGARVIKVERPGTGDVTRSWPPFAGGRAGSENGLVFQAVNAGKLSLTLDYKAAAGAEVLRRLVEDADALIEDAPSARDAGLGLGDEELIARVPRLVITRLSSRLDASATREAMLAGLHVFAATLAALWRAAQSEHGQVLELDAAALLASTPPGRPLAPSGASPLVEWKHPAAGALVYPPPPFALSDVPAVEARAPLLGEHSHHVLHDLIDWETKAIEELRAGGIV